MPSVVQSLHYASGSTSELPWWTLSGRFWVTVSMAILVPLCFLRRLDSLRHTSYVALFSVGQCFHEHLKIFWLIRTYLSIIQHISSLSLSYAISIRQKAVRSPVNGISYTSHPHLSRLSPFKCLHLHALKT